MLRFENTQFTYAAKQTPAIHGLSCEIPRGSFHFLCGPSGAGKTTLFRMMYLDLLPTAGRFFLFGKDVKQLSIDEIALTRRRMGIVFQDFRLMPHLSVADNVVLPLTLHGRPTPAQEKAVKEILNWVGLGDKISSKPSELSGGEQQRVAIARAVVNRPQLLIADEPTGNIDSTMGRKIFHLFTELHKHGTTVVVATHDRELVQRFKFPCLYLADGSLARATDKVMAA